jgi:glycosyltransferase involved in cell wall biosynthesis
MRILLATGLFPPEIGGPATYSKLLADEFPKRGISVDVLSFREVRKYPKVVRHIIFLGKCLVRGRSVDIIYAQDPVSVGFPSLMASKMLRKPFVVRIAGDYAWEQAVQRHGVTDSIDDFQNKKYGTSTEFLRKIQRFVARHAHKVITPSHYFQTLVSGWLEEQSQVVTIYNGIDLSEVAGIGGAPYVPGTLVSAGRLVTWKGFEALVELMKQLPEWKLTIVGEGPEEVQLKRKVRELHLEERVSFTGKLSRLELLRCIAHSEIFILNTSFESFSFQVVEAMAVGTPVITTNIGNLEEIVTHGKEGLLVSPNNIEALRSALESISSDVSMRKRIVDAAKRKAQTFSMERTLDATAKLLSEVRR